MSEPMNDIEFDEWTKKCVFGSIKAIKLDERGKKQTVCDMAGWSKLTETKIIDGHLIKFVLTGIKSGVIVIDFDDKEQYHDLTNTWHNETVLNREPIFDATEYPTVETKNGFHVYFQFTDQLLQPDKNSLNVDIQGNGKRIYFAGSKYKINETDSFEYNWIHQTSLKPVPKRLMDFINDLSNKKNLIVKATPIAEKILGKQRTINGMLRCDARSLTGCGEIHVTRLEFLISEFKDFTVVTVVAFNKNGCFLGGVIHVTGRRPDAVNRRRRAVPTDAASNIAEIYIVLVWNL